MLEMTARKRSGASRKRPAVSGGKVFVGIVLAASALLGTGAIMRSSGVEHGRAGAQTPEVARSSLESTVAADGAMAKKLMRRWVPQLLVDRQGAEKIPPLAASFDVLEHQRLREQYGAILLRTGDYNFGLAGQYVSVAPRAYLKAGPALAWCRSHGLGPERCVAKRLDRGSSRGSVVTS